MGRVDGRTFIVTGASMGIGRAAAELLAQEGARVIGIARGAEEGESVFTAIRAAGGQGEFVALDVTDRDGIAEFWTDWPQRFGRLDGLFNVVGISGRRLGDGPLHTCTDEAFDTLYDVNVHSMFAMTRGALTVLLAQGGGGSIVNTSSVLGFSFAPELFATLAYATTKAAIIGMTRSAAAYYAGEGIRLNVLAPGLIRTPMAQRAENDPATVAFMQHRQPLTGQMGHAVDCAAAALYLLSPESSFVTGQVLSVDGGWSVVG